MPSIVVHAGSREEGLTTGELAGIIVAVLVGLALAVFICGICICVVCRMKGRSKKRLFHPSKSLQSPLVEGGTAEQKQGTMKKLKNATTSFTGSLFSLNNQHSYSASDFELHLEGSNVYVTHKDRNTSVTDSWSYSPKPQTLPRSLSNPTNPPNGEVPRYQYEVATMPLHNQHEKTPTEHPLLQHYDTPRKHTVDINDEGYTNMKAVFDQTGGERTEMANEPGNYEVPISSSDQKAREYRSQTPSPEPLLEVGGSSGHDTGSQEGGVADVLAPPTEFNGGDTSVRQAGEKVEESSESTEVDTHEGATFV